MKLQDLDYEGKLSDSITGNRRNVLIRQFQGWKGTDYVPQKCPDSIRWSDRDPLIFWIF